MISFEREPFPVENGRSVWEKVLVDEIHDNGFENGKGPRVGVIFDGVSQEENIRLIEDLLRQAREIIAGCDRREETGTEKNITYR